MKEYKNVYGTMNEVNPLEVSIDTVYIRSNIKSEQVEGIGTCWVYDEVQYTKDEYIKLLADKNKALEKQIEDTEVALLQLYESMI